MSRNPIRVRQVARNGGRFWTFRCKQPSDTVACGFEHALLPLGASCATAAAADAGRRHLARHHQPNQADYALAGPPKG